MKISGAVKQIAGLREGLGPEGKFIPRGGGLVAIVAGIMFLANAPI